MKLFPIIFPSAGGGLNIKNAQKGIRLARYGCSNRPFYHVTVNHLRRNQFEQPIEQLGSYDPMPNHKNELLLALNVERIQYWIGEGAVLSRPVAELLGLAGLLPIHPMTYLKAWRARGKLLDAQTETDASADEKSTT